MRPALSFSFGLVLTLLLSGAYYFYFKVPSPLQPVGLTASLLSASSSEPATRVASSTPSVATTSSSTLPTASTTKSASIKKTN